MKSRKNEPIWLTRWVRPLAFGGITGCLGCLLTLLITAALLLTQDIPQTSVTPLALVAAVVGAFLGGLVAGRVSGQNGWLIGLMTGILLFLLLLIAGGFALLRHVQATHMWVKLSTMLVSAAVGGIVGVNVRKRH